MSVRAALVQLSVAFGKKNDVNCMSRAVLEEWCTYSSSSCSSCVP